MMSSRYYLPLRHDAVARAVLTAHVKKKTGIKPVISNEAEFVEKHGHYEYWWNVPIKTLTRLPHNKPDLLIWNREMKTCIVVEFSCPADVNITNKTTEKLEKYAPLLRNLQLMYTDYKFGMAPIIIGALGYTPKDLSMYLGQLDFTENETKKLIKRLQAIAVGGTVKIVKTFIGFRM
jgi:hypothetical protein